MFRLLRNCTPLPTPETAERMKNTVRTAMIASATPVDSPVPQRKFSPLLICCAPRPSEVAVPKSVAMMARMSMVRPAGPWTALPMSGSKALEIRMGRPCDR
jgi:hypothetical protein